MKLEVLGNTVEIDHSRVAESRGDIQEQLQEYLSGERKVFDLEIDFPGSFTGEVMRVMADIPYGGTRTYGEVADELDSAAVAVGQACGNNPVPVIVPCHRVVASDGIGGYGHGVKPKRKLLDLESGNRS